MITFMQVFLDAGCEAPPILFPSAKMLHGPLRKATPSPNKFTNMPESPTKRQLLPPTRYNIEVTKLKTVTIL